jgi:hypothetical protein
VALLPPRTDLIPLAIGCGGGGPGSSNGCGGGGGGSFNSEVDATITGGTEAEDADCDGVVDADADGTGSTDSDDDAATDAAVGPEKTGSSGGCTTVQSSIPRQAAPWAFALLALSVFRRERD